MSRIMARDWLFKLVFELTFQKNSVALYEEFLETQSVNEENKAFVTAMYSGIVEYQDELLTQLEKYIKGYNTSTMFKVDLAILLIALYEIKYYKQTEAKVVANESVELAKKYSTEKSHKFINGVIASIIKDN